MEPDRIAFLSDRNDDQVDIYIMDADGTNGERVTVVGALDFTWAPDGRLVAYSAFGGIFTINDDGSWPLLLLEDNLDFSQDAVYLNFEPAWSPDGSKVAFVRLTVPLQDGFLDFDNSNRDIFVADVDGGNVTQLTDTLA